MATIKLNSSICHFFDCIDKTVFTPTDWEEFEEYQNNFVLRCLRCINHMFCSSQFESSILMFCCAKQNKYFQQLCKIWLVQFDHDHAPLHILQTLLSLYVWVQFYQHINKKGKFDPLFDEWPGNLNSSKKGKKFCSRQYYNMFWVELFSVVFVCCFKYVAVQFKTFRVLSYNTHLTSVICIRLSHLKWNEIWKKKYFFSDCLSTDFWQKL